ncbi:right-handed parallel beta-helix repeat-containing protein [Hyalangium rubrum]|uniref:NosD domain-containing protein n=1 Tax=Hyalangium rubrum TaxID=3103134 RepID=A0ABU5H7K0_9BACT|nr:right-handed parallel beta-helix repeat-containing protein [Hyalangium sp. s54d21]MDY7229320.1 NosD domain-containing protein [Hyalangium sp. s54d21]
MTVPQGITLTIDPGVRIKFAETDGLSSGYDLTKVELIVQGTLNVQGTSASPVTMNAYRAYGIFVQGTATLNYAHLIDGAECLGVFGGTATVTHSTFESCAVALYTYEGMTHMSYSLVIENGVSPSSKYALMIAGSADIIHNTITGNTYGGIWVFNFTGTANIYDNIITSNDQYGIHFVSVTNPTRSVHHNDVWNHATNYTRVAAGTGSISANPRFVSDTSFVLQTASPCRNAASDGTDMGAFPSIPPPAASIVVTPSSHTMAVQGTKQFSATAYDASGNPLPNAVITWAASAAAGSVSSSGLFTAGCTPGTYTAAVTATVEGHSAIANVTLQPGAAATISLSPSTATVPIHGIQTFTATVKDACGNALPAEQVSWGVTGGGTISSSGVFTAGTTPGTFTNAVTAQSGSLSASATVTVTPGALASLEVAPATATLSINGTQQFTATGKDSAGNTVPASITWSVVNGGGSINPSGLFTAGTVAGTFAQTVKATSGTLSATASVTVNPGPIQSVAVAPASVTLPARGARQFTATATDAWGNTVSGTPAWTVQPAAVGTIDATGSFTAGGTAGSYPAAVTATLGGVSGSASVTISASSLARIVVSPSAVTLEPLAVRQFTAQGQDADGNVVSITPAWSVVSGAGSITQDGLFTATQAPGSYLNSVVATANGVTGTSSITVTAGGIQRVALSPQNPTVAVNGTIAFSAKAFDAFDNELPQLTATWEVVNGGGTLDASGVFTAGATSGAFANTVKVTLGGLSATTSVTVSTDVDGDGLSDAWELAHGLDPSQPGDASLDPDGDTLSNLSEFQAGTNPQDADTDDDGALDGKEQRPSEDTDGDGLPNARDPDSDNDALFDGMEMAVASPHANTDTSKGRFIADTNPATSTAPLIADTDGDGRKDGEEDANHNGKVDSGETDPNHPDTFCSATPECGSGQVCEAGVCVDDTSAPEEGGGGCGCNGSGAGASVFGLLLLSILGRVGARRR